MHPGDKKALVIAQRSRKNLDYIYSQKMKGADVEEFTQLLNSMLGMLICLREEYFKGNEVTWDQVFGYGLKPIPIEGDRPSAKSPNLKQSKCFSKLVSNLRHAFSHNCFEIIGDPISSIRVWNLPNSYEDPLKDRSWQAELSEKQLKCVAYLFVDYLEKIHG